MHAQRQPMDVVKDASSQVGDGRPAAVPEKVHESLKQHAEHIHDELERKDAALQAELKRAQVSSSVIQQLRQELLKTATASSQATNALDLQDHAQHVQRISVLETELHFKDIELQSEVKRHDLSCETINVLRTELHKKGPRTTRPAQLSIISGSSKDSRRIHKCTPLSPAATTNRQPLLRSRPHRQQAHSAQASVKRQGSSSALPQKARKPKPVVVCDRGPHPDDRVNMSVDATSNLRCRFVFVLRRPMDRNDSRARLEDSFSDAQQLDAPSLSPTRQLRQALLSSVQVTTIVVQLGLFCSVVTFFLDCTAHSSSSPIRPAFSTH